MPWVLLVPFDLMKGQLMVTIKFVSGQPVPHTVTSARRLYLVRGNQRREIHALNDLCREVKLLSPRAALSYVRLPTTAPYTWYLFQQDTPYTSRIEAVDRSTITPDFTYSKPTRVNVEKTIPNGVCGIVDHDLFVSLKIPPTTVKH